MPECAFVIPSSQVMDPSLKMAGISPKTPEIENFGLVISQPMEQAGLETRVSIRDLDAVIGLHYGCDGLSAFQMCEAQTPISKICGATSDDQIVMIEDLNCNSPRW